MNFLGTSFIVPALLAFAAFGSCILVVSRMTNLGLPLSYRVLAYVFAVASLALAIDDVTRDHIYASQTDILRAITEKSIVRVCIVLIAAITYTQIGHRYPNRMAASQFEPTPRSAKTGAC
jgi:hypothetical protein